MEHKTNSYEKLTLIVLNTPVFTFSVAYSNKEAWHCSMCGAVVLDVGKHEEFHNNVTSTLQRIDDSDFDVRLG